MRILRPRSIFFLVTFTAVLCVYYMDPLKRLLASELNRLNTLRLIDPGPEWWRAHICKGNANDTYINITLPVLMRDIFPSLDKNIFLVESACKSNPAYRAWCSVESHTRENPNADVWYVMTSPIVNNTDKLPSRLLDHYPNLRIVSVDLDLVFNGTTLEEFFKSGRWHRNTPWPVIQLSDLLRVLLTWRFGGFYSDTDTVCIKDLSPLENVLVTSTTSRNHISNGVFHFYHHHEFLTMVMSTMIQMYHPKAWGSMGPSTFGSCVQRSCNLKDIRYLFPKNSSDPVTCGNVTILPEFYLLPYPWNQYRKIFEPEKWDEFVETHSHTFSIHSYGKVNGGMVVKIGSNSIYDGAARTFCPLSYFHASANHSAF
ncbi:lactosylceramide 4-alpha-galactosyltransferase-like [Penaeus chinensis]|uniref:lactosylceramide 4-alpha-galactosyltransferase-like n=1 Tax=Penaeus chinensis TaxID=139456 RepID=UPI001FB67B22|nr:lactosylceramide 4-alpha-galactosyltransferase-like [Penaeus chinensis]